MESGRSGEGCRAEPSASVPDRSQVGIRRGLTRSCWAMSTLAARIAHRDSAAFVGRAHELRVVDELLADGGVLLVHGPGGIGKSVLLREIRRARRGVGAVRDRRARPAAGAGRDRAGAGRRVGRRAPADPDRHLRADERARRLPALDAAPVAARERRGRHRRPRRARAGLVRGRLGDGRGRAAARRVVRARGARPAGAPGLRDDPRAAAIARWAGGLPLALRLGAAAAREDPAWTPGTDAAPLRAHLQRVSEAALAGPFADVFALACVARVVTPALIADVLPGVDAAAALRWLAGCAFADAAPGRRHAARARPPAAARGAGGAGARARAARPGGRQPARARAGGDLALTIDLADLVEDPAVRAGYSWDGGVDHHVTGPGTETARARRRDAGVLRPEPGHVLVARDADGEPCGYAIAFPPTPTRRSPTPTRGSVAGSRTRAGVKRSCGGTR